MASHPLSIASHVCNDHQLCGSPKIDLDPFDSQASRTNVASATVVSKASCRDLIDELLYIVYAVPILPA